MDSDPERTITTGSADNKFVTSEAQSQTAYIPYLPVIGSLKILICGVTNVNSINNMPIKQLSENACRGRMHLILFFLNKYHSKIYVAAADTKNIVIFI